MTVTSAAPATSSDTVSVALPLSPTVTSSTVSVGLSSMVTVADDVPRVAFDWPLRVNVKFSSVSFTVSLTTATITVLEVSPGANVSIPDAAV